MVAAFSRDSEYFSSRKLVEMALSIKLLPFHYKENNLETEEIIIMILFKALLSSRVLYCWDLHIFAYTVH